MKPFKKAVTVRGRPSTSKHCLVDWQSWGSRVALIWVMSSSLSWVLSLQPWLTSTAAWGKVTRPCWSTLSICLCHYCICSRRGASWWLAHYPPVSKKIFLFDRHDQETPNAKAHEQTRRESANEVQLTLNTLRPCGEVILLNSKNKNLLNNMLCNYPLPHNTNSLTSWIVSLLMQRHTSPSTGTCYKRLQTGSRPVQSSAMTLMYSFSQCIEHRGFELSKFRWKRRCLGLQQNCSAVWPQKVQPTYRCPRTVRLWHSFVPLWKRKAVSAEAPRNCHPRYRSYARTA